MKRTYVIAEAGVNHNGSLDMALKLIEAAAAAGADSVKFQTFKSEKVISRHARKAEYQTRTTGSEESQLEMVRKLELGEAAHRQLIQHCKDHGIQFLSTPFDLESVDLLTRHLDVPRLKIPSGEITNGPLILRAALAGRPIILSTGMSTLDEIETALGVLAFGYTNDATTPPSVEAFRRSFQSDAGQAALKRNITLLHCTTEYPAPYADVNLMAMETMRSRFGLPVGYSDHTEGIEVSVAAAALGAVMIEKHFTLDRNLPGPDHKASVEPRELEQLVRAVRNVDASLGSPEKKVAASEQKNIVIARKSLVAAREIGKGELFSEDNLTTKRPGSGLDPMRFWELLGRPADRDYREDDEIQ